MSKDQQAKIKFKPLVKCTLIACFFMLFTGIMLAGAGGFSFATENWTDTEIVQAIYLAEGGAKAAFAYGIRSVSYSTIVEAKHICYNTIRNNRRRYAQYGYKQYPDFLSFLASRYCPANGNLTLAEKKLNKNWLKNVRYFLEKKNGKL